MVQKGIWVMNITENEKIKSVVLREGEDEVATELAKWMDRPMWLNYLLLWVKRLSKKLLRKEVKL